MGVRWRWRRVPGKWQCGKYETLVATPRPRTITFRAASSAVAPSSSTLSAIVLDEAADADADADDARVGVPTRVGVPLPPPPLLGERAPPPAPALAPPTPPPFAAPLAALAMLLNEGQFVAKHGVLHGFDGVVWLVVVLNSLGGLLVAATMKYADNIVKCFAAALAILWCRTRPFIAAGGSTIVGATSLAQLEQNLDAFELPPEALTAEMVEEINEVHMRCRSPSDSL